MATVISRPRRHFWIQFRMRGKHHTWRLGRVGKAVAEKYRLRLELLVASVEANEEPEQHILEWIDGLSEKHQKRLISLGLIVVPETTRPTTLREFGEFVIKEHYKNAAENTVRNMKVGLNGMVEFFGNRKLTEITKGDLTLWREDLITEGAAPATAAFYLKKARRFLALAVDHNVLKTSPFQEITVPSEKNPDRKFYVDHDTIKKLFRVCSPEWQAAICLCRFGGMRFPSEVFPITWDRVNFDINRIVVRRSKTKRDVAIPMNAELRRFV